MPWPSIYTLRCGSFPLRGRARFGTVSKVLQMATQRCEASAHHWCADLHSHDSPIRDWNEYLDLHVEHPRMESQEHRI